MKVYVATRYEHADFARKVALKLMMEGVEITSRWLTMEEAERDRVKKNGGYAWEKFLTKWAEIDAADVMKSDALVILAEDMKGSTGGAFFEMGLAFASNIPIYAYLGNPEERHRHIFFNLSAVKKFDNLSNMLTKIVSDATDQEARSLFVDVEPPLDPED